MHLFLNAEWKEEIDSYFNKNNSVLVGFQIGASTISRMWFTEKWVELGKKLLKKYSNINIVLTGSPNEKELTLAVEKGINDTRVLNLAGRFG